MAKCSLCGNDYDKSFTVLVGDESYVFDSFECAIQALAPECAHCSCRIIGHGSEVDGKFYCCAHCAASAGHSEMRDRSDGPDPALPRILVGADSNMRKRDTAGAQVDTDNSGVR